MLACIVGRMKITVCCTQLKINIIIYKSQSGLAQLVRFLVIKLTHPDLNTRFDMSVIFTANYSLSGRRCPCRQ
jgi:hypothetical protein